MIFKHLLVLLSNAYPASDVPDTSYVRGLSSGATGYITNRNSSSTNSFNLTQTSGSFLVGEQIIINENIELQTAIISQEEFTVEDIKAVYQDADSLNSSLQSDFIANTVLEEKVLPNFGKSDLLNISGSSSSTKTGKVGGRFFSGVTGIKLGRTIKYQICQ